jgi:AI-2E family transporter
MWCCGSGRALSRGRRLFVGFADLIPLVGATLDAVVAIAVAALHSLPAAIVVLVVFVVYQQLENHVLQPVIMSRTVELSALTVLVSILIGVELFGFLGALLAIPVAGVRPPGTRRAAAPRRHRQLMTPPTRRNGLPSRLAWGPAFVILCLTG